MFMIGWACEGGRIALIGGGVSRGGTSPTADNKSDRERATVKGEKSRQ
jgi:hypothetical protein